MRLLRWAFPAECKSPVKPLGLRGQEKAIRPSGSDFAVTGWVVDP